MALHRLNIFEHPIFNKHNYELALTVVGAVLILGGVAGTYFLLASYTDRFYPGTMIDGRDVSGISQTQANKILANANQLPQFTLTMTAGEAAIASTSAQLGLQNNTQETIAQAYAHDQHQPLTTKLARILGLTTAHPSYTSSWTYDSALVAEAVTILASQIASPATYPAASLGRSGQVATLTIAAGKAGQGMNKAVAQDLVSASLTGESQDQTLNLDSAVETVDPTLDADQVVSAKTRATKLVGKSLTLTGDDQRLTLNDQKLISLLKLPVGYDETKVAEQTKEWQKQVNRPAKDVEFVYDPQTLQVATFVPPQNGLHLDEPAAAKTMTDTLNSIETSQDATQIAWTGEIPLAITEPTKTLASTNDLGINQVIGFGESDYDHSIPSRIHNVSLTSQKISNHIIKPGEEFSFNKTLGDVSAATGFKPAYVIRNGQTELGDGGGVCQVSTTLFRAVLDAGLDITKRRAHSYRVTYYELNAKPGFDATVYTGDVDLRFINDTPNHILISSVADSKNLHMEVTLYGTSDGRSTEITNYSSWDARPAPEPVYTVDPTLPPGTVKQVDWAASGIRTKFTNVIKDKDGNVIREDEYASNYVPWSAKYLTGPT